ncbi:thermonuclease family protein [Psychromonas sp. KJ10-2]|uniref:thermonuclease family protein n=1 Tax=Psychromonas sp. KJ10-2 TaxID=3391822 RepID=UPI0039B65DBA
MKVQLKPSDYNNLKNRAENRKEKSNFNDKYKSVTVRVASINTEESVHSNKSKNTKKGIESSNYLKHLALNKEAVINCYGFGYYGRLICNVVVNNQFDIAYQMIITGRSNYITKYGENPFNHKQYLYAQEQQTDTK